VENKQRTKKIRRFVDKRDEVGSEKSWERANIYPPNLFVRPPLCIMQMSIVLIYCDSELAFIIS
jgi:hypothetical protein